MTSSGGEPPLRLLALDGGGIRGLSELLMLKGIMQRVMVEENTKRKKDGQAPLSHLPKPCHYFDLIGGTSTGGIIALMLGRLQMDVDTAIKHYDDLANHVFSDPKRWGGNKEFNARKLEEAIKSVVEEMTGDSESPLVEADEARTCRTFVCATNALNMSAVLLRTYQSQSEVHLDCKIWEAAQATSAAPAFFKPIEIGRGQPFIDGGLGRNNPSRLLLDEARGLFGGRPIGCFVSIGSGQPKIISIKKPAIVPKDILDTLNAIATDCDATHQTLLDLFTNLPNTYFRLSVEQGMQGIEFSEWEKLANVEAHTTQYLKIVGECAERATNDRATRLPVELTQQVKERKLCPLPVASFTGRKEILDKMHRYFDSDVECQRVFVLYGVGGSGKSQITFKFVQESQAIKRFSDIFYIDATNEQTLEMDLMAIRPESVEKSVDASLRWLTNQRDGHWLLLFDNADDGLKDFFPQCASGNILVTTRNPELRVYVSKGLDENITGMGHEDAKSLLLDLSRVEETDENEVLAAQIVQELHYFALAVSQAGAFIHCHSSLHTYRELYQRERDNLLQNQKVQNPDPCGLAVYATWKLSYDKLDASAKSFLQICSMLHHEGISEQMFEKASLSPLQLEDSKLQHEVTQLLTQLGKHDSQWHSSDFLQVVKRLGSYSLIEYDHQSCTYTLHPLLQHWSGTTIGKDKQDMKKRVLSMIGLSISCTFDTEDYTYRRRLFKHITKCMASLNPEEIDPSVGRCLALVYSEQGHWRDAERLNVVVVEKIWQLYGEDHPLTLKCMEDLATTYRNQGHWEDAETLGVVVMEKRKQVLGDDHPLTLLSMAGLADTYGKQGRWEDAEVLEVAVMEKRKRVLGEDHPDTLLSMANLAVTYSKQRRWSDTERLGVVVMEKRKRVLGEDHPQTISSMADLAATYRNQRRWKDAEELEAVVIEKRKRVLGEDHPRTLLSMGGLAHTYMNQGRWPDAEALEMVVMEKRKQVLGEDHIDTLTSMGNIATTYRNQNRWKDAEVLDIVVLEKRKQVLGEDHPLTFLSMGNLATTYSKQGRWKDAEVLEVAVMEKRKRVLGEHHPHTLLSMGNLATTYSKQGNWKDAEALDVVVMEKKKQVLGEDHPETLLSMANLAAMYSNQGRWKDAEVLEVVVMQKSKQVLGEDHPDTLFSMENLADTYRNLGLLEDAEVLEMAVMEKKRMLGIN